MKKDIPMLKVEDIAIAIVPQDEGASENEMLWDVYIVNSKDQSITNLLVNSKGYGEIEGERRETTTLRHFFDEVGPQHAMVIEPIQADLFNLTNEYWISFSLNGHMYDKKYVFVKGSINTQNFTNIPFIDKKGVMIR